MVKIYLDLSVEILQQNDNNFENTTLSKDRQMGYYVNPFNQREKLQTWLTYCK